MNCTMNISEVIIVFSVCLFDCFVIPIPENIISLKINK